MVIARRWSGLTTPAKADEVEPYLEATGVGEARRTPGNQGALLLRADVGDEVEFTLLTFWDGWEAIKAFAGDDLEKAVLYEEDRTYFTRWDDRCTHMSVVSSTGSHGP